jgi:hypothetical protein
MAWGMCPEAVWQDVWKKNGKQVMRHWYPIGRLLPFHFEMLVKGAPYLFDDEFFEVRATKAVGAQVRTVKPDIAVEGGCGEARLPGQCEEEWH